MPKGVYHWGDVAHAALHLCVARRVDIITVKELLGHSTVIITMRYTHTNLDSKVRSVGKLAGDCYNPATPRTKMQQSAAKVSQIGH